MLLKVFTRTMSYYAVAKGRKVGIYRSWPECSDLVKGFPDAKFKKLKTLTDAEAFIRTHNCAMKQTKLDDDWPKDFDGCDLGDAELLTALSAAEGEISQPPTTISKKRKTQETATAAIESNKSKWPRLNSTESEVVGYKRINGEQFLLDEHDFVIVYTDGSCFNNGSRNACAGFGVYFGENNALNAGLPVTGRVTNNVGEIQAAIHAIKVAQKIGIQKLSIHTDSQFLIKAINLWVPSWKKKNWKLSSGGGVKNIDEFKVLDALLDKGNICVKWNYIKAHKGIAGNEAADKLARQGSEIYRGNPC